MASINRINDISIAPETAHQSVKAKQQIGKNNRFCLVSHRSGSSKCLFHVYSDGNMCDFALTTAQSGTIAPKHIAIKSFRIERKPFRTLTHTHTFDACSLEAEWEIIVDFVAKMGNATLRRFDLYGTES